MKREGLREHRQTTGAIAARDEEVRVSVIEQGMLSNNPKTF